MITWFHLADLQFGLGEESDEDPRRSLLDDIASQCGTHDLKPDLIFLAGDLTASGEPEEYERAVDFLNRLLEVTKVPKEHLFIVPGNHDMNWRAGDSNVQSKVAQSIHYPTESPEVPMWLDGLGDYFGFVDWYLEGNTTFKDGLFYVQHLAVSGEQISVLGLNSAWLGNAGLFPSDISESAREKFREQCRMAWRQLDPGGVRIVLVHHPLDVLGAALGTDLVSELLDNCDFVLHSHVHSADADRVTRVTSKAIAINGGSDPAMREHPSAYNWAIINFTQNNIRVHWRSYLPEKAIWEVGSPVPDGIKSFPLPAHLQPWATPLTKLDADTPSATDRLKITPDVNAFSAVFASRQVELPLCLGLFGDWGSGKTFFMDKMWLRIQDLAARACEAEEKKEKSSYCSHIIQIRFNAWHYIDTNLWASLANHIFRELAKYIEQDTEKKRLFGELETAKRLRDEAKAEQEEAQRHLNAAQEDLKRIIAKREKKSLEVRDWLATIFDQVLSENDGELKKDLDQATKGIGLPSAIRSAEDLNATVEDLRTFGGQLRASFRKPEQRRLWARAILLVFVVIPLVALAVHWALRTFLDSSELIAAISFVLAQVVAWLQTFNTRLKPVLDTANKLDNMRVELDEKVQAKRKEISPVELERIAELSVLEERELAARKGLAEAQERLNQAEVAVRGSQDIRNERRLIQFIQERVESKEYEKHLGIISMIHNDFDALSKMLSESVKSGDAQSDQATSEPLPRIDRIILYIDDLDRCPEDKVVEVLQAVHLLLAFKLFIVVVGVDSRWLLRSLERSYLALQDIEAERTGLSEEELWVWESTPQNYLEKIFQIPFHLPPMDEGGVRGLVYGILPEVEVQVTPSRSGDGQPGVPRPQGSDSKPGGGPQDDLSPGDIETQPIELMPPALVIKSWEREFIPALYTMLPTPRAVKRFVNTYRLLRARVSRSDLTQFTGKADAPGEYQVVMILLALLTGFPYQSPYIFDRISEQKEKGDAPWADFVGALKPVENPPDSHKFSNGFVREIKASEVAEWQRIYVALSDLNKAQSVTRIMEPFIRWAPRVAQFSFRAGQSANGF